MNNIDERINSNNQSKLQKVQIIKETLKINDMKKYSSYKTMKPLNALIPTPNKYPQSPTHSVSYRKLTTIDLTGQKPSQKSQIYPISVKHSNLTTTNAERKKMFSSKIQDTSVRPLTINRQNTEDNSSSANGYGNIRTKIMNLESRLNQIKRNYDQSVQNRKNTQKDTTTNRLRKQSEKSTSKIVVGIKNKENQLPNQRKNKQNQLPQQRKTQSKLLLERYQTNKQKLKSKDSTSTANFNSYQNYNRQQNLSKSPLGTRDLNVGVTSRKGDALTIDTGNAMRQNIPSKVSQKQQAVRNQSSVSPLNSPKGNSSSYLKDFVTTVPCQVKLSISHSTSETNLYKHHNKLAINNKSVEKNLYYVSTIINAFQSKCLTSFENLCRNHLITSLDILNYVKNANKQPPTSYYCKKLPPAKDNKSTIIFDLDQTLIHCNQNLTMQHDVALPIKFPNGTVLKAGINVRPYVRQCLRELSKQFQLIVFTASHECYGNVIVDYLDPNNEFISHRYFRDSCFKTEEGFYVKDLRVIDRDLKKVLLIDNAAYSYCFQLQNGVPVIPFYDNKADLQLKDLTTYLKGFMNCNDVRIKNQSQMKLCQYSKFKDTKKLLENLYGCKE